MMRHGLAFTLLILAGALTLPDPTLARGGFAFRPAFTGGPFRIVLPAGRPHVSGGSRIQHRPAFTSPARAPIPFAAQIRPIVRSAAAGPTPFRMHRRGFYGSAYPFTFGADASYYGLPYDPSDIPVYAPTTDADPAVTASIAPPAVISAPEDHACRAQRVLVPAATGPGDREITIVRC